MTEAIDVFISYAHADHAWVRVLAENLHQSGLNVFFDEWMIAPGDVLAHKLDEGIRNSRNGVLVVSQAAFERPWVKEEYAAMMARAVAGQQRLIPVLIEDAEMPPLLASRVWVDFRNADGPVYQARLQELIKALTSRPGPPRIRLFTTGHLGRLGSSGTPGPRDVDVGSGNIGYGCQVSTSVGQGGAGQGRV